MQADVDGLSGLVAELGLARARATEAEAELDLHRRLLRADDILLETVAAESGLETLRDRIGEVLGRAVGVVDLTVRYDVREEGAQIGDSERPLFALSAQREGPVASVREDGSEFVVMTARRDNRETARDNAGASRAGAALGAVVVEGRIDAATEQLLRRCVRMLGLYLANQERERGDLIRRRRELIDQVLVPAPAGIARTTIDRLRDHGLVEGRPFRILVIDGSDAGLRDFDHRLELDFGAGLLRAQVGDQLVALMPEHAFERIEERVTALGARAWGSLLVGHSPRLHMLDILPAEYALVQRVLQAARASSHSAAGTMVSLESYGAIGAFMTRVTIEPTRRAVDAALGPVFEYDAAHGTELADTAFNYLDLGRSVARVAGAMHVHENTVRQRVDRIAQLLGQDWAEGQAGLDHHILLAAHRLIG